MNYQTALFIILFAAMDISLALGSYFEVKGNEKAAKIWSSIFYTVIFLNIFRGFLEYENIPDNIFKITILGPMLKRDYLKFIYLIVTNMDNLTSSLVYYCTPIYGHLY